MRLVAAPARLSAAPSERELPFGFSGSAREYFGIWITNIALSVLTLGLYSAWAKVRTERYFYRNTWLDGSSFDYLAKGPQLLKGRLVVAALLVLLFCLRYHSLAAAGAVLLVTLLFSPWLLVKSLAFRARHSSYRNLRFAFTAPAGEAYEECVPAALLTVFTCGIGYPSARHRVATFIANGHRFGDRRFAWYTESDGYKGVYLRALLITVAGAAGIHAAASVVNHLTTDAIPGRMVSLVTYLYFVVPTSYVRARLTNLRYRGLHLGQHRLVSRLDFGKLLAIYATNLAAVLLSLGLLLPWAKVRLARYRVTSLALVIVGQLDAVALHSAPGASAVGDAAGDAGAIDFDLSL